MAGTATVTENNNREDEVSSIKFVWTSDTTETATKATTLTYEGVVLSFITVPDGGDTAPTASYDITLTDSDSIDVLHGKAANRSATATEYLVFGDGLGAVSKSVLTLNVSAAGENNGGTAYARIG